MATPETTKRLSPGEMWLSLDEQTRVAFLDGLVRGLNQGLRHCATEMAFSLSTRVTDALTPQNKLAVDSLTQQMRTWAKSGVTVFKFSRDLADYARALSTFYRKYSKYGHLEPAYLLIYMDDQHGMTPEAIFNLHEHSLHGFKV